MDKRQNERIKSITEKTMVIGCDVGSSFHYARSFDYRGVEFSQKPFGFSNDSAGFSKLNDWIEDTRKKNGMEDVVLGFEPTGHYWINLAVNLQKHGVRIVMVDPGHVKKMKELDDYSQTKNDLKDPKVIAKLIPEGRFREIYIPEGWYAECRNADYLKTQIVKRIVMTKNSINRWLMIHFPEYMTVYKSVTAKSGLMVLKVAPFPDEIVALGAEGINQIFRDNKVRAIGMKKAQAIYDAAKNSIGTVQGREAERMNINYLISDLEKNQASLDQVMAKLEEICVKLPEAKYLLTVPGVGVATVTGFLGETGPLSRFDSPKQIQKLAGLSLVESSSGKHTGQRKISHRGRKRLRHVLFEAGLIAVAKNQDFKALHEHYTTRPKNALKKKQSIVAISCKLIRVFYTLGVNQQEYDPKRVQRDIRPSDDGGSQANQ